MSLPIIDKNLFLKISGMSWAEINYGISKGFISINYLVDYAISKVETEKYSENEFELASCNPNNVNDIINILNTLCNFTFENEVMAQKKWSYVLLHFLRENYQNLEEILSIIEEIYSEFNYPIYLERLVRYMPSHNDKTIDYKKELESFLEENSHLVIINS